MPKTKTYVLERQTEEFIEELSSKGGKPLYKLTPEEARAVLEQVQSESVEKPQVTVEQKTIPVGDKGKVSIRIVRPKKSTGKLPPVLYIHGGGWILGSFNTHERLIADLADGANAAIVFVEYDRSPEAKYPVAVDQAYATLKFIAEQGKNLNLDSSRLAIAGDSVGGDMALVVSILAKELDGTKIHSQALFYPVTSSDLNTDSYNEFADGPWLTKAAMEWFWNAYEPNANARKKYQYSPLNASIDQLEGLPKTLLITDENDVLRDEGEEMARRLMQAGVDVTAVRFLGTHHDFMMLNPLAKTPAVRGAIKMATSFLRENFGA